MFDFLPSCLRRHKKKLLFLGGVVGGVAFFNSYLKRKFIEWEKQRATDVCDQIKKSNHFESTMMTCDSTFATFTRKIRDIVVRDVEVDDVVHDLKQQPTNKLHLWEQLKILVFTQVIGEMYAQCLLCILLRVQMCILSGYFFATRSTNANSTEQQQKYMSHIEVFMLNGLRKLLVQVRCACARNLKNYALDQPMRLQDIEDIIIDIQADINISDSKVLPDISDLLLYSSESSRKPSDDKFLDEIKAETKDVLECDDFKDVLDACVTCGITFIMDQMSECYAFLSSTTEDFVNLNEYTTHLAKLIPTVHNLHSQHDPSGEAGLAHALVQNEKLNNFAANIYEAFSEKC